MVCDFEHQKSVSDQSAIHIFFLYILYILYILFIKFRISLSLQDFPTLNISFGICFNNVQKRDSPCTVSDQCSFSTIATKISCLTCLPPVPDISCPVFFSEKKIHVSGSP